MIRRCLISLLLFGCFDPSSDSGDDFGEYDDDDLPAGSCRGTGGQMGTGTDTDPCDTEGTTGAPFVPMTTDGPPGDQCMASSECNGGYCSASWDDQALSRGPLACNFACVPTQDDTAWCGDDSACCDRNATCTGRGYCVIADE